jgi:hypothetical protein
VASTLLALAEHPAWLLMYLAYIGVKNVRRPSITFLQDLVGTSVRSACFLFAIPFFFPARVPPERIRYSRETKAAVTLPPGS